MAVGKGGEKAEIDSQRRHVLAATFSPRGEKRRTAEGENVLEIMSILIGDAVAIRIPFDEGSDARTADRVEAQKALAAPAGSSKFSQAQSVSR